MAFLEVLVLVCGILAIGADGKCGQCQDGFQAHGESCYWLSRVTGNYAFARSICGHLGSRLAIITSKSEDDFLRNLTRTDGKEEYYVGGSDLGLEGTWRWEGGIPLNYTNWSANQPSLDGNCMGLYKPFDYAWNDLPCDLQYNFVCEHAY